MACLGTVGAVLRYPSLNAKSDKLRRDIIEALPPPVACHIHSRGRTYRKRLMGALRSMADVKLVGPDELPVELLKLRLNHHPTVLREFYPLIKLVWHSFG